LEDYKKQVFILLFILISGFSVSQDSDLISRYRPGAMWFYTGIKPAKPEMVRKYDRLIVDLVYNDWVGKSVKPFKNNWSSIGFNTALMFDVPLVKRNKIALGIGLAYGLYRIDHKDLFNRKVDSNYTAIIPNAKQYGIEKSIFKVHSLSIPLELRFRGENWKHLKIHLGGKFSYQFMSNTVLSSTNNKLLTKQKTHGFYDFNPINTSAHIRFGIRNWAFYAQYNFIPFFKSKQSVQINGFQFGISLSLY
jgi:hypothetical protein